MKAGATHTTGPSAAGLVATPLSTACAAVLSRAEHACIGVSPFNSYFSVARIRQVAVWACQRFSRVDFFVPDGPSAYTLEALGYSPAKAEWKARRQGQYTRNKIRVALRGVDEGASRTRVLGWAELQGVAAFSRLHAEGHALYTRDEGFRAACREASGWVLAGRLPEGREPDEAQMACAVRYLLAELPLFLDTPAIVEAESSVFCYHRPPAFLHRLYARELVRHPGPGQGFAVITPTDVDGTESQGVLVPAAPPLHSADHLTPQPAGL
ncbi:tRNA-dependent cyclodipeptide synthase (plasmid) [Streptomyces mirabilis]|uniref:tRNA-dependent cyclodipeptide synthase n=1 Tax=Streptomyces mirabilis TaxID=68239 RepID=UPI001BAE631E|nr:tRNA-dependent cyclodipeptide synthase [Streptomyces mirabilis]QUW85513.1 tRNA-dependent cyclodipeptide synthase [Streptomyces mirabilis]